MIAENQGSIHQSFANIEELTGELANRVDELAATLQTTLQYFQDLGGNSSDLIDQQRPTLEEMLLNRRRESLERGVPVDSDYWRQVREL
mgnify:CR=1 FL=1